MPQAGLCLELAVSLLQELRLQLRLLGLQPGDVLLSAEEGRVQAPDALAIGSGLRPCTGDLVPCLPQGLLQGIPRQLEALGL